MTSRRTVLGILAAGVGGAIAGCLDSGPEPYPDDEAAWVQESPSGTTVLHATADGLYLGSRSGDVIAIDHDGERRWEVGVDGISPVTGVATPGDLVVALTNAVPQEYGLVSDDGEVPTLIGVDAGTGEMAWSTTFDTSEPHASAELLRVGENAYVVEANGRGRVTAVDLDDGSVEWRRELGSVTGGGLHEDGPVVFTSPGLHAFTHDGEKRWEVGGVGASRIEVEGDFVFAGSGTHPSVESLRAFDVATGELRWEHDTDPGETDEATDSFLCTGAEVVTGGGSATSLARDGTVNWQVDRETVATDAPVADGRVFPVQPSDVRENDWAEVFAVDLGSGEVAWERSVPTRARPVGYHGGPIVANPLSLAAIDASSGDVTWTHEPPELQETVAVERGRVYVSTRDRNDEAAPGLYAYDLHS